METLRDNASKQERAEWFCGQVQERLPELYATARRLTGNTADAEDLVADAVARAWMRLDALEDEQAFRAWIFRILTNSFISSQRSGDARAVTESYDEATATEDFSLFERLHQPFLLWWSNPEQAFLRRLMREDFERAIGNLPESFRIAVVLCDLQGFSYREVAEVLDVPIGTVKSRLARGRSLLQKDLWEHARDAGLRPAAPSTSPPE